MPVLLVNPHAHQQGARILLSEFAQVPGTIDGNRYGKWADMAEPLAHNKTAFTLRRLGTERVRHIKALCRDLNSSLTHWLPNEYSPLDTREDIIHGQRQNGPAPGHVGSPDPENPRA